MQLYGLTKFVKPHQLTHKYNNIKVNDTFTKVQTLTNHSHTFQLPHSLHQAVFRLGQRFARSTEYVKYRVRDTQYVRETY
jgi:hypothetical protein